MRQEIQAQGVHTGEIILEEIRVGDSIVFPTVGELKSEKHILTVGWEPLVTLHQAAAETELISGFSRSIFNTKGGSPDGQLPEKMGEWEIGFAVVIQTPLALPYEEHVVALCRASKKNYVLLRSRETRVSDKFN